MVRISLVIIILLVFSGVVFSQSYNYGYLVEFSDKQETVYNVNNPGEFLSERAIQRRAKFNIPVTEEDFPVSRMYTDSLQKFDAKLHNTSRWFNSAVFYTNNAQFPNEIANVGFVSKVTLVYNDTFKNLNQINKFTSASETNIPSDLDYGATYNQITMCSGQFLHNQGFLGEGMQIAVLDAGFWRVDELSCFDSLRQNNRILGTYDFVKKETSVYEDYEHGMKVLSIISGILPGTYYGSAPRASFWLLRSEDIFSEFPIEEENWIAAAEFADSAGVDLISSSLGYSKFNDSSMDYSYEDTDGNTTRITKGAEKAFSKGIFVVNSAGNEGNKPWRYITAPSDGEHVLCVGAVNEYKEIASFSGRGPSSDGRVKPDVVARGEAAILIEVVGQVASGNGTSYSCPLVAGLTACLWQALPELSNTELLKLIRESGNFYNYPDYNYGYGIPNYANALLSNKEVVISDYGNSELVNIRPNPVKSYINFDFYLNKKQDVEIAVFDMVGTKVFATTRNLGSSSVTSFTLNGMDYLQRGVYLLSVFTDAETISTIIVKD